MSKPKIITFYLPQYHPIPENDQWWGEGFTDWRNVAKARPKFKGHYQPQIPADLGFYDLRLEETRIQQAQLAKTYGLSAFCYYHYWFNGKMLLETPFNEVLRSGKPDFDFCLCWANENWTRRWDGLDHEILIQQDYGKYDPVEHFNWLFEAFKDKRYVKINKKPLFLIYNASGIPAINEKLAIWRNLAVERGFPGLYICSVNSIHNKPLNSSLENLNFDAYVDFIPNSDTRLFRKKSSLPKYYLFSLINKIMSALGLENESKLPLLYELDYRKISEFELNRDVGSNITFPCVIPSWDNSARKKNSAIIQNDDPGAYEKWLIGALKKAATFPEEEQFVFINAWNEWAEGCHLEPDLKNGKGFLEATLRAVQSLK